jgi:hypothetical protein
MNPTLRAISISVKGMSVRLHVSREGLQERHREIIDWLDRNCGRGKYWMGSGYQPGVRDATYVYLQSADTAKRFVDEVGCADLVKCELHPLRSVVCPVYTPDHD